MVAADATDAHRRRLVTTLLGGAGLAGLGACGGSVDPLGPRGPAVERQLQALTEDTDWVIGLAELRDVPEPAEDTAMVVLGHTSVGDGGGGVFYFDPASVAADDDGCVVAPNGGNGRWHRVSPGPRNPNWYGAFGAGGPDEGPALRKLFAKGSEFHFPPGEYRVFKDPAEPSYAIYLENVGDLIVSGAGPGATILRAGEKLWRIFGITGAQNIIVRDLTLLGDAGAGDHACTGFFAKAAADARFVFSNCEFRSFRGHTTTAYEAAGLEVNANDFSYESLIVTKCAFSDIHKILNGPSAGLVSVAGAAPIGPARVQVSSCSFDDIGGNDGLDSDGIRTTGAPEGAEPGTQLVQVSDCSFRDCRTRSVKTQARMTLVTNCHVRNTKADARFAPEIDSQRGSSVVRGCSFEYGSVAPPIVTSGRANKSEVSTNPHQNVIVANVARIDDSNATFGTFADLFADSDLGRIGGFVLADNVVLNVADNFATLHISNPTGSPQITGGIHGNIIEGVGAADPDLAGFVYLYLDQPNANTARFRLGFRGNMNLGGGTTTRQVQVHTNAANRDLTVECTANGDNYGLDPTQAANGGGTYLDSVLDVAGVSDGGQLLLRGDSKVAGALTITDKLGVGVGPHANHEIDTSSGAHLTAGGVWTDFSSRAAKRSIRPLRSADAAEAIRGLTPVRFEYRREPGVPYVGFIAEDAPPLVATRDRRGLGAMSIVATLTAVVKQQQAQINRLEREVEALRG